MFLFLNPGLYTCALTTASQFYCRLSRVTAAFFAFLTQDSDFVATVRAPSPKPALPVFYDKHASPERREVRPWHLLFAPVFKKRPSLWCHQRALIPLRGTTFINGHFYNVPSSSMKLICIGNPPCRSIEIHITIYDIIFHYSTTVQ